MIELIQVCANQMPVPVAQAIIKTESGFNPYAIGVNSNGKSVGGITQPNNHQQAVQLAYSLLQQGRNIDLGLSQINSANLKWLGLSIHQVFQPCENLKAMQKVYLDCYARAGESTSKTYGTRMQRAWSCYNTGNFRNGFFNGYVNKVTRNFNEFQKFTPQQKQYIPIPHIQQIQNPVASPMVASVSSDKTIEISTENTSEIMVNQKNTTEQGTPDQKEKVFHSWDIFREF